MSGAESMSILSASVIAMVPLGLVIGGIVSMVTTRVPERLPVFQPGPTCPGCESSLGPGEIIPVFSWARQRGACRHCGDAVSMVYPVVELLTAGLFVAAALRFDSWLVLIPHLVLFSSLIAISVTDLYLYRIPDRITFPTLGVSAILIVAVSLYFEKPHLITAATIGALIYSGFLLALHLALPAGMGYGDVKLALVLGLFLGWNAQSVLGAINLMLTSLIIGSLLAAVGGGLLMLLRKLGYNPLPDPEFEADQEHGDPAMAGKVNHALPFGPSLAIGTIIAILFTKQLLGV